ncbi:MAG: MCE family protein [Bdellovibrionales bacterium]|nr:MCE family protein [Bdellovibrionales bacterium]
MFGTVEAKVGLMVVAIAAIIGSMTLKVSKGPGMFQSYNEFHIDMKDASGLIEKSAIRMAGIKVGFIDKIELEDGHARVWIFVKDKVKITSSGYIEVKADGILGDKHIEMHQGVASDRILKDGDKIENIKNTGSLDDVLNKVGDIADSLKTVADNLNKATTGDGDSTTPLGRIVKNIEKLTKDISEITGDNKEKINNIVTRVESITKTIDELVNDETDEGFRAAWQNAVNSLKRIDTSLKNIEEVTEKINNGKGTIGRLINEDDTVEKINTAVDNVNEFLGGATKMETSIDFHTEALMTPGLSKSYLGVRIQPGLDRYYDIQIVDDPRGVTSVTETNQTGTTTSDIVETKTDKSAIKFTALFAKNFYNFTLKGGLIESTGGFGFDYMMLRNKLRFSVEAYDFEDFHLKSFIRYNIWNGVYVIGGADDVTDPNNMSSFIGAGLFLTNDDLKVLATKAGL